MKRTSLKNNPEKVRAWQRRAKPLVHRTSLKTTKRINPRNAKRAADARARNFGAQADLCRELPCVACRGDDLVVQVAKLLRGAVVASLWAESEPHHEPPRSCGGKDADTVPLCRHHHDHRHRVGLAEFDAAHGTNLVALAKQLRSVLEGEV